MQTAPAIKRWTREEYYRLGAQGFLDDQRDELIGGQIVQMAPEGPRHAATSDLVKAAISAAVPAARGYVRVEKPLALGRWDEPQPDVAVVVGQPRDYGAAHPTAAQTLLVIEVGDSSEAYDLSDKAAMYAAAGITDYWVVCPASRRVVVCRQPVTVAVGPHQEAAGVVTASPTGMAYAQRQAYRPGETLVPLATGGPPVAVADLLL